MGSPLLGHKPLREPIQNWKQESSEELSDVEAAAGEQRIHLVAFFPFEMIPVHAMIKFQVPDNRFDCRSAFEPSAKRRSRFALSTAR